MTTKNVFSAGIAILALLAFSLLSCERETQGPLLQDSLSGKWQLDRVSGGITGGGYTPAFSILVFSGNDTYELFQGATLKSAGTYRIYEKENEDWIEFTHTTGDEQLFEIPDKEVEIKGTELTLSDPCCDQYEYHFTRSQP